MSGEERWTIYVCPVCNDTVGSPHIHGHEVVHFEQRDVVRLSRFEEVEADRDYWSRCANMAAERAERAEAELAEAAQARDDWVDVNARLRADLERARRALKEVRVLVLSYPNVLRRLDEALAEARERGEDG